MKDYKIVSIDYSEYKVMIFSEEIEHPLSNIKEIEKDLENMNLKNYKVIFDMILCRGNTKYRFIECIFDGHYLQENSMEVLTVNKKHDIRKISTKFLSNNRELVENSILTSVQQRMILKGIAI
ncbi:type II toxin-antitoxin system RnlB family antitoxin [Faecalibacillus faecis]|uniref:type II toxin-antitoxin system RnlB family antitoxin n=1 Tax=Faecalibacillus faecis TaxID=1982628 RepID=UPI003865E3D2